MPKAQVANPGTGSSGEGLHIGRYPVLLPNLRDPRMFLAGVTTSLQVLGQVAFNFNVSIAQILITMATCAVIEFVITFTREKTLAWPASALLTGNGIALILRVPGTQNGDWWSLRGWHIFVGTAILAMASKYLVKRHGKHIFNPSNFALVVVFVALGESRVDPQVLWWGSLSVPIAIAFGVIIIGSFAVTHRVSQGYSAVSFWVTFAALTAVIAASGHSITANWHVGPVAGLSYWTLLVTSPEVLVFQFFMITDPKTAPSGRVGQSIYGAGIALVSALIISTQGGEFGTKVGILSGLVVLCLLVRRIEANAPAKGTPGDSLPKWLGSVLSPRPVLGPLGVLLVVVVLGGVLGTAGRATASDDNSPAGTDTAAIGRRGEVELSSEPRPDTSVDPAPSAAGISLDQKLADKVGTDVALDLQIEATAILNSDSELAAAGVTGVRLTQTRKKIGAQSASGDTRPKPQPAPESITSYQLKSLTLTLIKPNGGPQTPPELALKVVGDAYTLNGASRAVDSTFTVRLVGGAYLITNEFDSNGKPVGDQRKNADSTVEAPVTPTYPGASPEQLAGMKFRDVSVEVGLVQPHGTGSMTEQPLAFTGGAAVADFDDDGDPDVFVTRIGLSNLLYRNDNGSFTDVTVGSGLESPQTDTGSTAATWVDINGDGALDLVVLGLGETPNRLFLGDSAGHFRDATTEWGLPSVKNPDPDSVMLGLAVGDYDHDGLVDLVIVGSDPYASVTALQKAKLKGADICGSKARRTRLAANQDTVGSAAGPIPSSLTRLLRNTGSSFEDRSDRLGVDPTTIIATAPRFFDMDGDGWDDLVIGGQLCTTTVLRNDTAGGFSDVTSSSGVDKIATSNGIEIFDADGDGRPDWFSTGVSYPTASGKCPLVQPTWGCGGNHLMLNNQDGTFTDAADGFGVRDAKWAWGAAAEDLNNDTQTDLMVTNGFANTATWGPADGVDDLELYERSKDTNDLLWVGTPGKFSGASRDNREGGPLPEASMQVGINLTSNNKAVVPLDFNLDGKVDLLVIDTTGHPSLYRNETSNSNHWIAVSLNNPESHNRRAIGSTIKVDLGTGQSLTSRVSPDGSFQSGVPTTAHFGLGTNERISTLTVRWPDGHTQQVHDVAVDQRLVVTRE